MKRALRGEQLSIAEGAVGAGDGNGSGHSAMTAETIDELRLDALHWLKIGEATDARQVFEGAAETLWRLRPNLFVAVPDEEGVSGVVLLARDYGYQCWKMEVPYFNPGNFNCRDADIFAGRTAFALLAIPEEMEVDIDLDRCTRVT
jgi:hypothetical protein